MTLFTRLARRLRYLFRRDRAEAEMAEEMRFHLEQRAADFVADGLEPDDARYAAQRKFGNVGSIQESARDTHGWGWLDRVLTDVRLAFRQLASSPGYAVVAIVTLGLGIGANTSMFCVLNGILLRPLPYPEAGQLERIYRATAQNPQGQISAADYRDFQRVAAAHGEVAAFSATHVSLSEPGAPADMAYGGRATANFLSLLGVPPQLGRDFRGDEDTPGRDRVVILSQRVWKNRFLGARDVIGRTIRIDGEPHQIIGVLPASFNDWRHLGVIDLFRPMAFTAEQAADRESAYLRVLFRRAAERPSAAAAGFVAHFGQRLAAEFPELNAETTWRAVPLRETVIHANGQGTMKMLVWLSGFVLLIACCNLANLLLARTMSRAREFAVRGALGASRTQLLRPLIAESLVLSLSGAALALLLALWFRDWAAFRSTGDNGEQVIFTLDWRVFSWTFAAALVTALVFGIAPALFALRLKLTDTLKSGGRGATAGRGHHQFGRVLIIGQFALAMILLAGAAQFIRGLHDIHHRRSGWESHRHVIGTILLPTAIYAEGEKIAAFHRLALERIGALPGVASASISSFTPALNWPDSRKFLVDGQERPPLGREPAAVVNAVSPQYFATFGTRVIAGRAFAAHDTAASAKVFVLSESMARGLFGNENPIGRRLARAGSEAPEWGEIVGVVQDVQAVDADVRSTLHQLYQPMAQAPRHQNELVVRTTGLAPSILIPRIRKTIAELDADLPVRQLEPFEERIVRDNYEVTFLRDILASIALLGLGLASLGIYGVIARTMAQRTTEFAIRLALGARVENLTRLVLASGVKLALVGSLLGLLGAFAVSKLLASGFPGLELERPGVIIGTTLLLVGVALLACWIPARRARKVDAMAVLRSE